MTNDPYQYFRIEAREIVQRLGAGILELESGGAGPDLVARLLRDAHTLKGAARVVRQPGIADVAHAFEDVLSPYRDAEQRPAKEQVRPLFELVDRITAGIAELDNPPADGGGAPAERRTTEHAPLLRFETGEMDELFDGITEIAAQLTAARRSTRTLERLRHILNLLTQQLPTWQVSRASTSGPGPGIARSISLDLRASITTLDRQLADALGRADRELRHVRVVSERLRLARAETLFAPLRRAARDAADALGKEVTFTGRGGDVRLDAHVLATVHTALLHVVRNAVAHGVETPAARRAAGKPAAGSVTVEVTRKGRLLSFACQDDGRGFDLDAIRRAAQLKGLRAHADRDADLVALLLQGGISTAGTVTGVSGRGIGMDVVREVSDQLGGELDIRTEPGAGATVELVVPLSMVALDGLVVESDGQAVTIPLDCVRRTLRVQARDIERTPDGDRVLDGDQLIPFVPLRRVLAAGPAEETDRAWSTVVVHGQHGLAAVGVDRLLGTASVVVRPLPDLAPAAAAVGGVVVDADGSPRLVLDADGLVGAARSAGPVRPPAAVAPPPILVIDDSLTTRMLERSILESAGYEVDLATSGEEGLVKARAARYGLFLVDVEMPGIDGFTFIERVQADPGLRDTPSILVTSRAAPEDRRRGEEVGAKGYVVKGEFDQGVLLARIRALLERP